MFYCSETDGCVTVRDRDTMEQVRMPIDELVSYIDEKVNFRFFPLRMYPRRSAGVLLFYYSETGGCVAVRDRDRPDYPRSVPFAVPKAPRKVTCGYKCPINTGNVASD